MQQSNCCTEEEEPVPAWKLFPGWWEMRFAAFRANEEIKSRSPAAWKSLLISRPLLKYTYQHKHLCLRRKNSPTVIYAVNIPRGETPPWTSVRTAQSGHSELRTEQKLPVFRELWGQQWSAWEAEAQRGLGGSCGKAGLVVVWDAYAEIVPNSTNFFYRSWGIPVLS